MRAEFMNSVGSPRGGSYSSSPFHPVTFSFRKNLHLPVNGDIEFNKRSKNKAESVMKLSPEEKHFYRGGGGG